MLEFRTSGDSCSSEDCICCYSQYCKDQQVQHPLLPNGKADRRKTEIERRAKSSKSRTTKNSPAIVVRPRDASRLLVVSCNSIFIILRRAPSYVIS